MRAIAFAALPLALAACSEPSDLLVPPGTFTVVLSVTARDSTGGTAAFGASAAKFFVQMDSPRYQVFLLNIPSHLQPGKYQMSGIPAADGTVPDTYMILNMPGNQLRSRSGVLTVLQADATQLAGVAEIDAYDSLTLTQNFTHVTLRFNATCGELYACP